MTTSCCPGSSKSFWWGFTLNITWHKQSYAQQTEAGILKNLPLWSRRPNYRACWAKMSPSQSYKRRCVACQHFRDDQTLWLQAGAGEDDVIHLLSSLDRVVYERQEVLHLHIVDLLVWFCSFPWKIVRWTTRTMLSSLSDSLQFLLKIALQH